MENENKNDILLPEGTEQNKNDVLLPEGITEAELDARVNAVIDQKKAKLKHKQKMTFIGTIIMLVVELLIVLVLIVSISTAASGEKFWYFGAFAFSVVATDSMTPTIKPGDFTVIQKCSIDEVEKGDIIVFTGGSGFGSLEGKDICHRAVEVGTDEDGKLYIVTKGDKHGTINDTDFVTEENFIGKCVFYSSFIGAVHGFLSNSFNWLFIVVLLIVIWFGWSQISKLLGREKKEKKHDKKDDNKKDDNKNR